MDLCEKSGQRIWIWWLGQPGEPTKVVCTECGATVPVIRGCVVADHNREEAAA
jgi:hypothetical protein